MNKHTINYTAEDEKQWFITQYTSWWLKQHHPEVEQLAIEQYNLLKDEVREDKEIVQG